MPAEHSAALSSVGVGVAVVGSVLHDYVLQVAGILIPLLVHLWTEQRLRKAAKNDDREMRYWRAQARALQHRIDGLTSRVEAVSTHPPKDNGTGG
jgi:hypothetical protein